MAFKLAFPVAPLELIFFIEKLGFLKLKRPFVVLPGRMWCLHRDGQGSKPGFGRIRHQKRQLGEKSSYSHKVNSPIRCNDEQAKW